MIVDVKELILSNIKKNGHHLYVVSGKSPLPRYAYTIGLYNQVGFEIMLAGAAFYKIADVVLIFDEIAKVLRHGEINGISLDEVIEIPLLGFFTLRKVQTSWVQKMCLGYYGFYGEQKINVLQIIPDSNHLTSDVPDMSQCFDSNVQLIWMWLEKPWSYNIPENSIAVTNIATLKGKKVTEVTRWEEDNWELFAGNAPDISSDELRPVPLGTLLAIDPTLEAIVNLKIGEGLWRDEKDLIWHEWIS
jgi:hypothetical protein